MAATDSTVLVASGSVAAGRRTLHTIVLLGGAAAGTCELRSGGATGAILWKVGTDAAGQVREFALQGLQFPIGIYAALANIATACFEWE